MSEFDHASQQPPTTGATNRSAIIGRKISSRLMF